ncbi:ricin-type beta-trefoil lectin domain protein [Curtobacterium sp. NPDC087080]|uniref:ricin-type beta-trefoil lectin domain protein n=1 Tax=Curtobacterium sp. NPDC087080 TaxID=3363965 RepID=UPI00382EA0B9
MRNTRYSFVRICALGAAAFLTVLALPAVAQSASAGGQTPGSYVDYDFDGPTSGFTQEQQLDVSPGDANAYWSTQFGLTKTAGGYIGMQTFKNGSGLFLMSIWDSTDGVPGPEAECITFAEDGSGQSCRIEGLRPEIGHRYRTTFSIDADGRATGSIDDLTTGRHHLLGSVQTTAHNQVESHIGSWTEYFDWNSSQARCEDEAYSKMTVTNPVASGGRPAARTSTHTSGTCASWTAVTAQGNETVQENGLGNSFGGRITEPAGRCLDVQGGSVNASKVDLWDCNGGANQNWVHAKDGSLHSLYKCLDANGTTVGSAVTLWTCNGGTNQQWAIVDGRITSVRSGLCASTSLSAGSPATPGLTLQDCDAATRFGVPGEPLEVMHSDERCLDRFDHAARNGAPVGLWSCTDGENQHWKAGADDSLRTAGVCLDANGATVGAAVTVWSCNGGSNQGWRPMSNGALQNVRSGLCLTADDTGSVLGDCATATRWT